jgi:uncharacterized protein YjiS (DUF1127 family)
MILDLRFYHPSQTQETAMTTITAMPSRMSSSIGSSVKTASSYLAETWMLFAAWKAGRDTRHALHSLDDRTLADIGVSRGGIEAVVRDIERRKSQWTMAS